MKKWFAMVLVLALLCGPTALAEDVGTPDGLKINTLIEDGSFVIQIPVEDGDMGWYADDAAGEGGAVKLYDADVVEDTFVARYDAAGDGDATVELRHYYNGFACDQVLTWDLRVADGAVQEVLGGSHAANSADEETDPYLVGEWIEAETQFTRMTVGKNPERGWDVEIASPLTHGAYVFKTTIYADCLSGGFVYDKGKFWDVPITEEEDAELGEAKIAGTAGTFTFAGDEQDLQLVWSDDARPGETVVFERMEAGGAAGIDTADWAYYTFEGSSVAMKIPPDFAPVHDEPVEGIFYDAGNADVVLQVIPVDGDFADRDELMEYFNNQEYVTRAIQIEINGVELVYAEGADDDVMAYAVISPEGTTYCFTFIPQSENGLDAIEAITQTICPSSTVPEAGID